MNSNCKKMKKLFAAAASLLIGLSCCLAQSTETTTIFMNDNGDGSITVRATGSGKTKDLAIKMARKKAVRDIIFTGVNVPGNVRLSRPLLNDMNAQTTYEDFFASFFKDNGPYTQFISVQDKRGNSNVVDRRQNDVVVQTTVRVLRSELKKYLKDNNFFD